MEIYGDELKWKRGENDFFIILRAKSTLNPKNQQVYIRVKVVAGGQFYLLKYHEDHPIILEATTSLTKSRKVKVGQLSPF